MGVWFLEISLLHSAITVVFQILYSYNVPHSEDQDNFKILIKRENYVQITFLSIGSVLVNHISYSLGY